MERSTLTLRGVGCKVQSATEGEKADLVGQLVTGGNEDPERLRELFDERPNSLIRRHWREWTVDLFNHRQEPKPLLATERRTVNGVDVPVAQTFKQGRAGRTALALAESGREQIVSAARAVCLNYAVTTDDEPREICEAVPFDLFPSEVWRLREFVDKHGVCWQRDIGSRYQDRAPLTPDIPMTGIVYFLYTADGEKVRPRYIGMSQRDGADGLGWAFQNATADSVLTRWGYGEGQHLGELSCALFPDEYSWEPKRKYEHWAENLFLHGTPALSEPLYIEVIPWFRDSAKVSEQNLIQVASRIFGDYLLNEQHA